MRTPALILGLAVAGLSSVAAQEHEHSPYAGHERSEIPSLSAKEQADLRDGAGMGLARAAELNRYPGPKHVLELADSLELSATQREQVALIRKAMSAEAVDLGARIIEAERSLGLMFKHGHIDSAALREATAQIASLQGELRYAHLVAHLSTRAILDSAQVDAYDRLRGYEREKGVGRREQ